MMVKVTAMTVIMVTMTMIMTIMTAYCNKWCNDEGNDGDDCDNDDDGDDNDGITIAMYALKLKKPLTYAPYLFIFFFFLIIKASFLVLQVYKCFWRMFYYAFWLFCTWIYDCHYLTSFIYLFIYFILFYFILFYLFIYLFFFFFHLFCNFVQFYDIYYLHFTTLWHSYYCSTLVLSFFLLLLCA